MIRRLIAMIVVLLSVGLVAGCLPGGPATSGPADQPATAPEAESDRDFVGDEGFCTLLARADELGRQIQDAYFPITFYKTHIPPRDADGSNELVDPGRLADLQEAGSVVQTAAKEQAEVYRSLAELTTDENLMDAFVALARHLDDVVVPKAALAASAGDFASYRTGVETMGWADRSAYLDPDYSVAAGTVFMGAHLPCGLTTE